MRPVRKRRWWAISDRLAQVFVNLLRNALNAVEAGTGKIVVRSRRAERRGEAGIVVGVEWTTVRVFPPTYCRISSKRSLPRAWMPAGLGWD